MCVLASVDLLTSIAERRHGDLDAALAELSTIGTATGAICDFAEPDQIDAWVHSSADSLGGIDICVGDVALEG